MARLSVAGLEKRFGAAGTPEAVRALDGVRLQIETGELLALVGPSGCGKTTLLRLIAGFDAPDAGELHIDGRPLAGLPPERRGVGVVFQHFALFPHLDVAANIAYGLRFAKPRVDRPARVAELLALVGLEGLDRRRPEQLSAGQRQRVALARALAPRPKLLLLDEPLSALDVQLRQRLRLEIRAILRETGTTALYITHDQEEALAIADRVAVMEAGRLVQVDQPQAVYWQPGTAFVAQFVGQGNVFSVNVLEAAAGEAAVAAGDARWRVPLALPVRAGDALELVVRPERLAPGEAHPNRLAGVLADAEYLGPSVRLHVRWAGRTVLAVCPGEAAPQARAGEAVVLSFAPEAVWTIPAPSGPRTQEEP